MSELNQKNILVVGSSRGIGASIVKSIQQDGGNVISTARTKPDYPCDFYQLDITSEDSLIKLRLLLQQKDFHIDGLVICAAKSLPVDIEDSSESLLQCPHVFNDLVNTNLKSIYNLIFQLEVMLSPNSSIVILSSIGAHQAFPQNPGYQVAKAGLEALSRSLAYDLAPKGIRSNTITLGYFKTEMTSSSFNNINLRRQRTDRMIIKRWGDPEDATGTVKFLLSQSSSYITGSTINIDGGWLAKGL